MRIRIHAYTLIECLLAIGMISSVLLAIMTFLPVGMDAMRKAGRRTVESRIMDHARVLCASSLPGGDLYFNDAGALCARENVNAIYIVHFEPVTGPTLPGDTTPSLRRVKVTIGGYNGAEALTRPNTHHLTFAPP